jgi:thymidylate synthase
MRFSLADGVIPILTTKRVAYKTCFEELFWFIRGSTSNAELREKNVTIWDGNSSREFLDSRGLTDRAEGDLGPVYGFQWRHFNAPYANCETDYTGQGVDQLAQIIADLKNPETRSSRRHILSAWNPCQLDEMALPPCHMICQFNVRQGKYLSCALFQRSGDVGLGVPFNIASYSMLTHIIAAHCGLVAEEFVHFIGNCHIYEDHVFVLKCQLEREPMDFPKIRIANIHDSIEKYKMEDIEWITPYKSHGLLKMKMSA